MLFTSSTLPYRPVAGLSTPVSSTVALPWLLLDGFAQLILLFGTALARVNTCSVGLPACGLPLNSSTHAWTVPKLACACALPVPTRAFLHAFIACAIVFDDSWLCEHVPAALGVIL